MTAEPRKHHQTGRGTCSCGYDANEAARDLTIGADRLFMIVEHVRLSNGAGMHRQQVTEGTLVFMRSKNTNCLCCPGGHVYARTLSPHDDWHRTVSDGIWGIPEGATVRIIVEWDEPEVVTDGS